MGQTDWALLINWVTSGFIGLVFGIIGGWVTYRRDRRRDDIAWQKEKQKFQEDWEHQKELLEIQFEQRLKEHELQITREENERLRNTLLQGVNNPLETIDTLQRTRARLQMEHLVLRAEMFVPESGIIGYLRSVDIDSLSNTQLLRLASEVKRANLALIVLQELQEKLGQDSVEELKMLPGGSEKYPSKLIEDMSHSVIWHHHNSRDAKGATWAAIASEAGHFNYNYDFLVYFLKLKNLNDGWQIPGTSYEPVPIPSIQEFTEILEVRLSHIKRVIDSGDLSLKWEWPSSWGYVPWNGPIINTNTIQKLSDEAYIYIAQREYSQTKVAIEQYKVLLGG